MNNIAYINGTKVSLEFAGKYHTIRSKVMLNVELNNYERSFYLLFIATPEEAKEFLLNEKQR